MGKYTYLCLVFLKKGCLYSLIWIDIARIDMKTAAKALVSESALCADCGCLGIGKRIGRGHDLPTRRSRNSFRLSFLLRRDLNNGIMARIKHPKEEWRDISGYEEFYKISSFGRIIAKPRWREYVDKNGNKVSKYFDYRWIEPKSDKNEYRSVSLCDGEGNSKSYFIHRLVAMTFIPNPDNLPIVNHKDENKSNNRADNLEWCTHQYNLTYGTAQQRKAESYRASFEEKREERIRKRIAEDNARMDDIVRRRGLIMVCEKDSIFSIGKYNSIEEAKFALKIKAKNNTPIKECLADKRESAYGYAWFYEKWQNAGKYGHI